MDNQSQVQPQTIQSPPEHESINEPTPTVEKKKAPYMLIFILFSLLLLCVILIIAYLRDREKNIARPPTTISSTTSSSTLTTTSTGTADNYDGWKTYNNEIYKYSLKYPSDWKLTESKEVTCDEEVDGCYERQKGSLVTFDIPDSGSSFVIDYGTEDWGIMYDFWLFNDNSYDEEAITLFGKEGNKALIYCDWTQNDDENNQNDFCLKGKENTASTRISYVIYYYQLKELNQDDCQKCYNKFENLKDPNGLNMKIEGFFSEREYSEEQEKMFDLITESISYK
ncbi:MAG: hypothetical protein ABIE03_07450 [Patescibacteria group bacterium]|nr:hypothetical protein [Patescibacteria group bacterium]